MGGRIGGGMATIFSTFGGAAQLLSPAGTILSANAVTDALGNDDVFAVKSDSHLWEHTPFGWAILSGDSFQSVSAGLDGAGSAVVYGVLTDNSLWEHNSAFAGNGWANLSPAGTILSASAGANDEVFAITADHHVWQHSLTGWSMASAGSFQALSGNAGTAGGGELFAVLTDGSFWEYQMPLVGNPSWFRHVAGGVQAGSAPRHA